MKETMNHDNIRSQMVREIMEENPEATEEEVIGALQEAGAWTDAQLDEIWERERNKMVLDALLRGQEEGLYRLEVGPDGNGRDIRVIPTEGKESP